MACISILRTTLNSPLPGSYNPQVPASGVYPLGNANPVFLVQSSGLYNQNELVANVNSKLNDSMSLFGSYVYNRARSNTDYSPPPQNTDSIPRSATERSGSERFRRILTARPVNMGRRQPI